MQQQLNRSTNLYACYMRHQNFNLYATRCLRCTTNCSCEFRVPVNLFELLELCYWFVRNRLCDFCDVRILFCRFSNTDQTTLSVIKKQKPCWPLLSQVGNSQMKKLRKCLQVALTDQQPKKTLSQHFKPEAQYVLQTLSTYLYDGILRIDDVYK